MVAELPEGLRRDLEQIGKNCTFLNLFLTNGGPAAGIGERMTDLMDRMEKVLPDLARLGDALVRVEPRIIDGHMDMITDALGTDVPDTPEGL